MLGLRRCVGSSPAACRGYSLPVVLRLRIWWLLSELWGPGSMGTGPAARLTGLTAPQPVGSPRPGVEPVPESPALAGRYHECHLEALLSLYDQILSCLERPPFCLSLHQTVMYLILDGFHFLAIYTMPHHCVKHILGKHLRKLVTPALDTWPARAPVKPSP